MQRVIRLIESRHLIHVRRANQSSVEPVGPRVIRTLNGRRVTTRVLLQTRPAMTTDVEEPVDLSGLIPNNY